MARDLTYKHVATSTTLSSNSDLLVPSQKAVKTYVDNSVSSYEPALTKGRIIGASGLTASSNSGSVIGGNVTVSIETLGRIIGSSGLTASSNSGTVIGGNVTVSIETLGRIIGSSPLTASNNSGSVIGGNVTMSIETLGRVIGASNQITVSDNSGSVIGGDITVSIVDEPIVNKLVATTSIVIATSQTITLSTDTGTTGTIVWDSDNVYICVGTNTWKKATLATW